MARATDVTEDEHEEPRLRRQPDGGCLVSACMLAALAVFGWSCVRQIVTGSVRYDDAFIANVARNLAAGHGYSSSFYGTHPFDPEITTGPTLVLPTAALLAVVGNRYWVPHLSYSLCVWLMLGIVAAGVRALPRIDARIATSVLSLGLLMFGSDGFGLLGEVPGSLMVAVGVLAVADGARAPFRWLALAGVAFGCGTLTKTVLLLAAAPVPLWLTLSSNYRSSRIKAVTVFTGSFLAPIAAFEFWKAVALAGLGTFWQVKQGELALLVSPTSFSGWGNLMAFGISPGVGWNTLVTNVAGLVADWGGWLPLTAALAATLTAVVGSGLVSRASRTDEMRAPCLLLLAAALVHGLWWLLLSPTGWPRHLLPAMVYWLVAMALLAGRGWIDHRRRAIVVIGLLFISQVPPSVDTSKPAIHGRVKSGHFGERPRRVEVYPAWCS